MDGWMDMIFTARQLQEKCHEQQKNLYLVCFDLTKAFDSVCGYSLWVLLRKLGCPDKFVSIIKSFHDGMTARVVDVAGLSQPFMVRNGTKDGYVLAPLLFNIFYAAMLLDALHRKCFWMPCTAMTSITEQTEESSIFAGWLLNPKSLSY